MAKSPTTNTNDDDGKEPANIPAATDFEASGAVIEDGAKDVDMSHPAVDSNPREGTTADMNRIDFNDPTLTEAEAVAKNLKDTGADKPLPKR